MRERRELAGDVAHRLESGRLVRTMGSVRAKAKIGLQNLAYNIRRLVILGRCAAAA